MIDLKNPKDNPREFKVGEKVRIYNDEKEEFGVFDDIDENGFLKLKSNNGYITIHSGEMHLS